MGSAQDVVLRKYLSKRAVKEIRQVNILGMVAAAVGPDDNSWNSEVNKAVKSFASSALGLEFFEENDEVDMRAEYDKIKDDAPRMYLNSDGKATVKGVTI